MGAPASVSIQQDEGPLWAFLDPELGEAVPLPPNGKETVLGAIVSSEPKRTSRRRRPDSSITNETASSARWKDPVRR